MEQNKEVLEEAKKRFQQIMEYTTMRSGLVDEAGDDEQQPADGQDAPMGPDAMGGAPDMNGGAPMGPDAQADPNAMGGAPAPDMGADPNAAPAGPEGFAPQVPQDDMMGGGMPTDGGVQPDDDVIDVSDLTDSQEETEEKIDDLDAKFAKAISAVEKLADMIKSNDEKIEGLAAEFEKRNPTQLEKLSMQTARSYPFNQTPEEYWANKEQTSNYRTEDDNNGKEQGQYVITKNDIDGATDWKSIADSLDDFDPMHQTMRNTMPMM